MQGEKKRKVAQSFRVFFPRQDLGSGDSSLDTGVVREAGPSSHSGRRPIARCDRGELHGRFSGPYSSGVAIGTQVEI